MVFCLFLNSIPNEPMHMKSLLLALGITLILSSCSFGKENTSLKDEKNTVVDGTVATSAHSGGQQGSAPLPIQEIRNGAGGNDGFGIK